MAYANDPRQWTQPDLADVLTVIDCAPGPDSTDHINRAFERLCARHTQAVALAMVVAGARFDPTDD